ncbi:uncharacterized protein LOC107025385 [Solanum pennellii]|uniref:Uncharacterized protein LOC107025385 n=1 Tax=Solanum pennellii TaxID=28526 RepID=A0ABM1VAF2_SOLPN|nr:uncharacterized protein LOC107025385 [Solanum pennellii]
MSSSYSSKKYVASSGSSRNKLTNLHMELSPKSLYTFDANQRNRHKNPDMEFSESDILITTGNRVKVKELTSRLDELDIIEDIAIATKKSYDEVIKARKRGWWESIEQLNEPEVTKFEAWMDTIIFNMQNRLNEMENGASSS